MVNSSLQERYDQLPFEGATAPATHPSRLAAIAQLAGFKPPDVQSARVLELGCGLGVNLIAMAQHLPGARFVGIDLSPAQIRVGQEIIATLGLTNVELKALDVQEITPSLGSFQYIVCHGVYSWVPAQVQTQMLRVYAQNLCENGIGHLSFQVHPGNYPWMVMHELLTRRARAAGEANALPAAREMLGILRACLSENQSPLAPLLRGQIDFLEKMPDWFVAHETLAPINTATFFDEFIAQAAAQGLGYLGDAVPHVGAPERLAPAARQALQQNASSRIERELWMDVLTQRQTRESILSHASALPSAEQARLPERVRGLYVASPAKIRQQTPKPSSDVVYYTVGDAETGTADRIVKSLIDRLIALWPESVSVDQLISLESRNLSVNEQKLCETLCQMQAFGLVEFDSVAPRCRRSVGEQPSTSPLARWQAARSDRVTNLRHTPGTVTPLERLVLRRLDGSRSHSQLLNDLVADVELEPLAIADLKVEPDRSGGVRTALSQSLEPLLSDLARYGLLF